MVKPVSPSQCADFLVEFFSPEAAKALTAELFRIEEESQENYCLGAAICCGWQEFPSFEAAQASQNHPALGIAFEGGFLLKK